MIVFPFYIFNEYKQDSEELKKVPDEKEIMIKMDATFIEQNPLHGVYKFLLKKNIKSLEITCGTFDFLNKKKMLKTDIFSTFSKKNC